MLVTKTQGVLKWIAIRFIDIKRHAIIKKFPIENVIEYQEQ